MIRSMTSDHVTEANLPAMEYRLTYVPTRFTYAQMIVRAFFTLTSVAMLTSYSAVMCMVSGPRASRTYRQLLPLLNLHCVCCCASTATPAS